MIVNILSHGNIYKKNPNFCQITATAYLNCNGSVWKGKI